MRVIAGGAGSKARPSQRMIPAPSLSNSLIHSRSRTWCSVDNATPHFDHKELSERVKVRTEKRYGKVYCLDVKLAA
jgi:hypothetical protein